MEYGLIKKFGVIAVVCLVGHKLAYWNYKSPLNDSVQPSGSLHMACIQIFKNPFGDLLRNAIYSQVANESASQNLLLPEYFLMAVDDTLKECARGEFDFLQES